MKQTSVFFNIFGRESEPFLRAKRQFWSLPPEKDISIHVWFLHFWALMCPNRPEMYFLRYFWVIIFRVTQNWSFFALNLHTKCNSGWFRAKLIPVMMKKHIKMSGELFLGFWVYSGAQNRRKWRTAVSGASEPNHLWRRLRCYEECQKMGQDYE